MTETVIITGENIEVDHQGDNKPNPMRKRPAEYVPTVAADAANITDLIDNPNPYWSDEANQYADDNPQLRRVDIAKRYRKHRIETP